jgi:dTDP-4-amino-4,6-dideoxygalactose transaminase
LNVKLKHLNQYNESRRQAAAFYSKAFASNPNITTPFIAEGNTHVFHQYTLILKDHNRDELVEQLASVGVPAMIYYPVPAHRQKMFSFLNLPTVDLPVTDWLTQRVVSLPIHTELDLEQLEYIVDHVNSFVK